MTDIPLDHIRLGNLIWYGGTTSMSGWDCPAEIIEVNDEGRWFRVRSLDDFKDQNQRYDFEIGPHAPESRRSMRVPTFAEVERFVIACKARKLEARDRAKAALRDAELTIAEFEGFLILLREREDA